MRGWAEMFLNVYLPISTVRGHADICMTHMKQHTGINYASRVLMSSRPFSKPLPRTSPGGERRSCRHSKSWSDRPLEGSWDDVIQGGPGKNGMAYFPQYVDAITNISVWGNFSWENDTKITNFGSRVFFQGHILWGNVEASNFSLFSLN